ncbi:unnamed protein product [Dracunculus medinensis]|uniref:RabGAP/TBC domain-containing protein n=1 Tax=Dracunculus medinensis TaxID=318479 RepID=A0A0N4UAE7_DRAME|nr:unnamed protein product [Dracunculus medinensis]
MYRVGHSPVSRSATLAYNSRRNVSSHCDIYEKHTLQHYIDEDPREDKSASVTTIPNLSKKHANNQNNNRNNNNSNNNNTSTKDQMQKNRIMELNSLYHQLWYRFSHTSDGRPDTTIVRYQQSKELPKDFVPFDVEKLFTERLLKAVDIDPKLMKEIC